jgi:hypothetical protein
MRLFAHALAMGLLAASTAPAADGSAYAETCADAQALHTNATWRNLLHYKPTWRGMTSLVDDPRFFNAPDGRTNPRAELAATLRAFYAPPGTIIQEHALNRFPARFAWLRDQLALDPSTLPMEACEPFEKIRSYLAVSSVTMVFPSAYMNGPASMFGHTLLVFDAAGKNRLLSRAVSYAARTDESIGPLFAFAGIAGLYPGYYAVQPYYDKVEQYTDIGHRDVWEYELDFTPAEVDFMLRHAWELQNIWSRYFFFDENCAYNLYFFLDVARPDLRLSDSKRWFVIPIDTVKAIEQRGLVRDVSYRPSQTTRIGHLARALPPAERALALDVAHGRQPPAAVTNSNLPATSQTTILELAAAYTQYRYTESLLPSEQYRPLLMDVLRARSRLGLLPEELATVPAPPRPDQGHAPIRLSAGTGLRDNDAFVSLRGRIAYHALLDNDTGYEPGSEIQFLSTEARYTPEQDRARLERLDVVQVAAMSPRDAFFKPASWKFATGLEQAEQQTDADQLLAQARTGAGLAVGDRRSGLASGWVEAHALGGHALEESDYAVGMGPATILMSPAAQRWKHLLDARAIYFGLGEEFWDLEATWGQDWRLDANHSLSLELERGRRDRQDRLEIHLRLNAYF